MARPDLKELRELFTYSPDTGEVWWKTSGTGRNPTKPAGGLDGSAIRISIGKKRYAAHRVLWAMHYGAWPDNDLMIDHIDGDVMNNKISNLRLATNQENQRNTKAKNYSKCKQTGKWRVSLTINGRNKCFGRYDCEELASLVAEEARDKYFKEFATKGVRYR